jgi:hypothetical protein
MIFIEFAHNGKIVLLVILALNLVLTIHGTVVKNDWGINVGRVSCPRCATPLPRLHWPRNGRQTLWGGYSCPHCRCEVDKWGRPLTAEDAAG